MKWIAAVIGGSLFLGEIKGDFPRRREIIDFKEYRFQVLEVDNRRILKVKFNRIPEGTGNDENGKDTK